MSGFLSLFIVINKEGKIVTWQLMKGTCFSEIEQIVADLYHQAESQRCKVSTECIDDCCKLCQKIQCVLGRDVSVKLDVFHAIQRITRTLPKRHAWTNTAMHGSLVACIP